MSRSTFSILPYINRQKVKKMVRLFYFFSMIKRRRLLSSGMCGVVGPRCRKTFSEKNSLENETIDGDSPVFEAK